MASDEGLSLKWKRPESIEYPKVWHTFKARNLDSEELVEYRIEDLTPERAEEVFEHMRANYIQDEPIGQELGAVNFPDHVEDYKMIWRAMVDQRVPLVCYKADSDEIVGANMLFVLNKEDNFFKEIYRRFKSPVTRKIFDFTMILYEDFNIFDHYGVDAYLTSYGLTVGRKYRGRAIGDHFLVTRKLLCKEFGLKLSNTLFTSDFSNRNADKAGFKTDVAIKYEDLIKSRPQFKEITNIKRTQMSIKTLLYDE